SCTIASTANTDRRLAITKCARRRCVAKFGIPNLYTGQTTVLLAGGRHLPRISHESLHYGEFRAPSPRRQRRSCSRDVAATARNTCTRNAGGRRYPAIRTDLDQKPLRRRPRGAGRGGRNRDD